MPIVELLLYTCHAIPLGKLDVVQEIGSALPEAYKSKNDKLVAIMKEVAWKMCKGNLEGQVFMLEHMLSSQASEINTKVMSTFAVRPEDLKRSINKNKDGLLVLQSFSEEEIDKWLMIQDQMMTYEFFKLTQQKVEGIWEKTSEVVKREM